MNIENTVNRILKKIMKKGIKSDKVQAILELTEVSPEKISKEIQDFQEDIKSYGSSSFLWLNDSYPNIVLLYRLLGINVLTLLNVRLRMKEVVDECHRFIKEVRENDYTLFIKEMEESKEFFLRELQPKDFFKKDPYINYINRIFTEQLTNLVPQIQEYSEKIIREIEQFYNNFESTSIKNLKELAYNQELINLAENIKTIQNETMPNLDDIYKDLMTKIEELKEVYTDNVSLAYQKLRLIKDIDSYNIEFTKFLARLFYIKDEGEKNKNYLQINPTWYDPKTRKKLKNFLNQKFKKKYPLLSKYLHSMFKYNKYRILEAHKNPVVRITNGIAYFSRSGKRDLKMDLKKISRETRTYSLFIESLRLF